jgi:hypothetical protein
MNTGDADSDYGFWAPGSRHDGAMSWGYQPRRVGTEWNPAMRDLPRGAWPVCGEADHGLVAGIEAACTVLFDDPLFGLFAYGGEVSEADGGIRVVPHDGVRQRLHAVLGQQRLHLTLDRDGFAREQAITLSRRLNRFAFEIESRAPHEHETRLTVEGLAPGTYNLTVGDNAEHVHLKDSKPTAISITVPGNGPVSVRMEPLSPSAIGVNRTVDPRNAPIKARRS